MSSLPPHTVRPPLPFNAFASILPLSSAISQPLQPSPPSKLSHSPLIPPSTAPSPSTSSVSSVSAGLLSDYFLSYNCPEARYQPIDTTKTLTNSQFIQSDIDKAVREYEQKVRNLKYQNNK